MELIESRVYTREQVADILQVSIASVDRYIKENRLPAANLGDGRTIRITGKDLAAFVESCKQ
ncbi:MAG: helix-turn-helix domain-containing protein [Gemmiger sp.]|jgi:excisionase family DNA binding protein|uniref:helix-turn-helix domain-containing protein n=1 Tax=Gemmiger sp. TaxID=2049027 RepID=UPI00204FE288|nr:helix-turn-helix domain-containing protein [Gemmiger sp.]MEE0412150.1 helix-turn-helix domain-containing protein [Gemmiger sp.]DAU05073.1 MAG TPA: helix-turn-helix domain protein [Caudoviricetes sp.]DAU19985.1 MAG TPA: helix-turn-helix domain protein [Caudoviricetes sp.]DAY03506.1 MAG TPA: helix-turn-helix domain protein [Caudoviricetes sp.]